MTSRFAHATLAGVLQSFFALLRTLFLLFKDPRDVALENLASQAAARYLQTNLSTSATPPQGSPLLDVALEALEWLVECKQDRCQ